MYKKILVTTICLLATYSLWAGNDNDTVNVQTLEEVSVVSTRNADGNNLSASNIGSSRLTEQNFGQNLPFLLSAVPSLVTNFALCRPRARHDGKSRLRRSNLYSVVYSQNRRARCNQKRKKSFIRYFRRRRCQ